MIKNPALGYTAALEVTVGGVPFDYHSLTHINIEYDENKHDMATVRVAGLPPQAAIDYRGAPVEITFETSPYYSDTFIGYVEEVRPVSNTSDGLINGSIIQSADIICLGVSYSMRGERSRVWEAVTLTDIVSELSDTYGFSYSVPQGSLRYERILQAESDFSFLTKHAQEQGLCLSIHGTHIDLWDPFDAISRRKSIFYSQGLTNRNSFTQPAPGQITGFKAKFGRNAVDGVYKDAVVSVMNDRGVMLDVISSEVLGHADKGEFPHRLSEIVHSFAEAENALIAESRKHYDYTGKLEVLGIAGALPGTVVDVDGFNSEYDGYWYVRGAKHTITTGVFTTVLDVARNASLQFKTTNVAKYRTPPAPVYIHGKWRASRLRSDVYTT